MEKNKKKICSNIACAVFYAILKKCFSISLKRTECMPSFSDQHELFQFNFMITSFPRCPSFTFKKAFDPYYSSFHEIQYQHIKYRFEILTYGFPPNIQHDVLYQVEHYLKYHTL